MIRIALQNKGRLSEASISYLATLGILLQRNENELIVTDLLRGIEVLFVRDDDIPQLVENGSADFGIVGENVLQEQGSLLPIQEKLPFGGCRLVIATPINGELTSIEMLSGKRIATSYPRLLQQYLKEKRIYALLIPLNGSVEIAPSLGLADAVCDLTQSGTTLRKNNLQPIETIFISQAVLIKSPVTSQSLICKS
ncbi:ATP phosphoribosyltransferase [Candidatus Gracilibacteria bacterium]|nr:ATP phosphoribosyltransferase [Candidatus Gracilibacteria bacterium]